MHRADSDHSSWWNYGEFGAGEAFGVSWNFLDFLNLVRVASGVRYIMSPWMGGSQHLNTLQVENFLVGLLRWVIPGWHCDWKSWVRGSIPIWMAPPQRIALLALPNLHLFISNMDTSIELTKSV